MSNPESCPISTLPYHTRQLIVVVDDPVANQMAPPPTANQNRADWQNVLKAVALPGTFLVSQLMEMAIKAVLELKERGINVLTVGTTEAGRLTFPPGHPPRQCTLHRTSGEACSVLYGSAVSSRHVRT
jgi:hypothetical protein